LNQFLTLTKHSQVAQLVEQVDDTDTDSVNLPPYRFESCPDYF
jgi:hypothetical protein